MEVRILSGLFLRMHYLQMANGIFIYHTPTSLYCTEVFNSLIVFELTNV